MFSNYCALDQAKMKPKYIVEFTTIFVVDSWIIAKKPSESGLVIFPEESNLKVTNSLSL